MPTAAPIHRIQGPMDDGSATIAIVVTADPMAMTA